jgi:hypothetical protein
MGPLIDETQLASIASWMRLYDITLGVCSPSADACAMKRWLALIRQFARSPALPANWAPACWAEIDGTWNRTRPNNHSDHEETGTKASFPARWLRLDLSPTYHPDALLEASCGTLPRTQFQTMVIETSLLNRTCITDDVVAALGRVHTLDLRYTCISDVGALALGDAHTLDLRGTGITDWGAVALRNVRILNLSETSITDEAVLELSIGSVHTLDLSETSVTDVGAVALSKSRTLHALRLRGTRITDAGAVALCTYNTADTLRALDLSETCITDVAAVALGNVRRLHSLDLRGTRITDVGAAALGMANTAKRLRTLDVSRTSITDAGAAALRNVHALKLPHLAGADAHMQEPGRAWGQRTMLLRAWVDVTYTRVPLCRKSTCASLRSLYAAYVRANPPVHERMLSQISFGYMLREIYDDIGPLPIWATIRARTGAVERRLWYVYLLRLRQ